MASVLTKISGTGITNVTIHVQDPPVAPPQPTQTPTTTGSASNAGASSSSQQSNTYSPDYYHGSASSIDAMLNSPDPSAVNIILGGGYSNNFLNNSTSTSGNYQSEGGGGSTSSSASSSSTSSTQQSNANSSYSGSSSASSMYNPNANSSYSGSSSASSMYNPTAPSQVVTVVTARPEHTEMLQYIIETILDETPTVLSPTNNLSQAFISSHLLWRIYETAWVLCTALPGEPIALLGPIDSESDGGMVTYSRYGVGIVTPEFLIRKSCLSSYYGLRIWQPTKARLIEICNEGWDLWLNWYAANKSTVADIELLYSQDKIKVVTTQTPINPNNMRYAEPEYNMYFPVQEVNNPNAIIAAGSCADISVLPPGLQATASNFTVTL